MSENQAVKERPETQQTQPSAEQSQYQGYDTIHQNTLFVKAMQYIQNSNLIFKICWAIGAAVTIGLLIVFSDMLKLSYAYKNINTLDNLLSVIGGMVNLITLMQVIINISVGLALIEAALIALCLFRNKELIKTRISIIFYIYSATQLAYVLTQVSKVNALAHAVNVLKSGNLGTILGSALTGGFSIPNFFETSNLVFLIVCLILMISSSVVLFLSIFKNIKIKFNASVNNKKIKVIALSVGAVAAAAILLTAGIHVYSSFIYKNHVDLTKYIDISYDTTQLSGESTATVNYNWPASYKNNVEIENFLNSIQFKQSEQTGVKNGDTIEVQAVIDPEIEKKDRIKIDNSICKSLKVSGLPEYVQSISDVPSDMLTKFENEGKQKISNNNSYVDGNTITVTFDSLYSKLEDGQLKLVAVYKVHQEFTGLFSYTDDSYKTYTISNIIINKDKKILEDKFDSGIGYFYISEPNDMVTQNNYTKVN